MAWNELHQLMAECNYFKASALLIISHVIIEIISQHLNRLNFYFEEEDVTCSLSGGDQTWVSFRSIRLDFHLSSFLGWNLDMIRWNGH